MDKTNALIDLAIKRKQTAPPEGSARIGDYQHGVYECDYVSPFTKGANNVNANIFLVLQDWSSHNDMIKPITDPEKQKLELINGRTPNQPTNKNLAALLKTHFSIEIADTYGTNLYPYIKPRKNDSEIPTKDLVWAAKEFALPQIEIIAPKLAICFGITTFNAVRKACGEKMVDTVEEGINKPFFYNNSRIFLQSHPGIWGLRKRGGIEIVESDWKKMAEYFHSLP